MSGKRTTVPAVTITNTVPPSQAPTQPMLQAVAAGTLRTVTASVVQNPVATVTPVSIAVSMAPVSIPPIVTMAQQTITVNHDQTNQQPSNNQQPASLPLSISGATAPLVSYPIMTQELRPVLQ